MTMAEAGILKDEQIDELLTQAEARLRAKAQATDEDEILFETTVTTSKSRKPCVYMLLLALASANGLDRLPKLHHGLTRSTYIKDNQGVAETNLKATIKQQQDS